MNYERIYDSLVTRAKNRKFEGYTEKHHIIPKCMGGIDDVVNLVDLTPEEHYVAHQLLVKMYPENVSLVYAANMMCVSSCDNPRSNKRYGWLKRKFSGVCKQRIGEKNGATGSFWITDGVANKKIKGEIPEGWVKGRTFSPKTPKTCCVCNSPTPIRSIYCYEHRRKRNPPFMGNTFFVNNGIVEKRLKNTEEIPEGFYSGRLSKSKIGLNNMPPKH